MGLNKQRGNMYAFVTHTWNTVKGECPHDCDYCFMRSRGKQKPIRFDEKELKTDLGFGRFIFVGSSCDMWAERIDWNWIGRTLNHCTINYPDNTYLYQSKNPARFTSDENFIFPKKTVLATTIESNINHIEGPPSISERVNGICKAEEAGHRITVTIEPIMKFDINDLIGIIGDISPEWVSIGADSKGHKLPEPSGDDVHQLISALSKFTKVFPKSNLKRLIGG